MLSTTLTPRMRAAPGFTHKHSHCQHLAAAQPRRQRASTTANPSHSAYARINPADAQASVDIKYRGLSPQALEQVFQANNPGMLDALAGTVMTPATSAQLLRRLEAELPPALTDVCESGDCVLVALAPGLLPLLERATDCCEQALSAGSLGEATSTCKAVLSLLCWLRFGSRASADGYSAVAMRCKQALKAAYDAGADVSQEDIVELEAACARSSPWLWLTPYFGHRCACAVNDFISAGWASGELAVRFAEAYCSLAGHGRYTQVPEKFVRLVRAALQHPLSAEQLRRLLAASSRLPVEMSIELELHARSEPADCWYAALMARMHNSESAPARLPMRTAVPARLSQRAALRFGTAGIGQALQPVPI